MREYTCVCAFMCVHNVNGMLIVHTYAIGVLLVRQGKEHDVSVSSSGLLWCLRFCVISYTGNNIEWVNNGQWTMVHIAIEAKLYMFLCCCFFNLPSKQYLPQT